MEGFEPMRRAAAALAMIVMLAVAGLAAPASAAPAACCICELCPGQDECRLPPANCDICFELGCAGSSSGMAEACNVLELCAGAPITSSAPVAGRFGISALAAMLAAVGFLHLARRRA
jgi:hypothetical protein